MLLHTWPSAKNPEFDVRVYDGNIRIEEEEAEFSLTLSPAEARDLRDKLSAALDAVEPQKVAA